MTGTILKEHLINYLNAQVDNNIRLGWDLDDIIIGTNFDYEYRGIKNYLLDQWENEREKYLDVYDRKKLSSVLEGDGTNGYEAKTPNYFFCQNGHPSELGHEKIRDLYFTHYTNHEFI